MAETQGQFKGIRGFLWVAAGILLTVLALGSVIYLIMRLTE